MRFKTLRIQNYRAITSLALEELGDTIIIAGPNGCGKSCVFDAIRLLKSIYGGYQPNEWQSFFGEFQISLGQRPEEILQIFQDRGRSLKIAAEVVLADDEKTYLLERGKELVTDQIWKQLVPDLANWRYIGVQPMATQHRVHEPEVAKRAEKIWPEVRKELEADSYWAELVVDTLGSATSRQSLVLELVFSIYDPKKLGIIDFHGSTRNYQREQVGGINLNIESDEDRMRQHSLYNYMNKYANLKTQMASGYVRKLLAEEIGGETSKADDLTETLRELFQTFFPGKEFLGPQPTATGGLSFPVKTPSGGTHDIDELSSGEKEVLYGYLRLRNSAPKNSVVLIDEPELHLNPRLIQGLAGFYHEHIGKALGNQLWLVTHSDTLLRDAVGKDGFNVFHMQSPGQVEGENQVSEVRVVEDVERIVVELVGDLAAYRPESKIVIFEGGGDSAFDVKMVSKLFPEFIARVNAVSGGNKRRVRDLWEVLESSRVQAGVPARFYSVTDRDDDRPVQETSPNLLVWNAYHIENYLLEPIYVLKVLDELLGVRNLLRTEDETYSALLKCAGETVNSQVLRRLSNEAKRQLVQSLDLGIDPNTSELAGTLAVAISRAQDRIVSLAGTELSEVNLKKRERKIRDEVKASLDTDSWRFEMRGRDILKRFVNGHAGGVAYEQVRNLIIARMRDDGFQPAGMKEVLDKIISGPVPGQSVRTVNRSMEVKGEERKEEVSG